jgi:hypothetical protein
MDLDQRLIVFAASAATQPCRALDELYAARQHELRSLLDSAMESVDEEAVDNRLTDPRVTRWYRDPLTVDRQRVRLDLVKECATHAVYVMREQSLRLDAEAEPPRPYGHVALSELTLDEFQLVPASEFQLQCGAFVRRGHAFAIPPTLPAANSSYWLSAELARLAEDVGLRIRLDPFIVWPLAEYRPATYLMQTYGRPLDWERIARLDECEHAEWFADPQGDSQLGLTQLHWTPRHDGVHFECEELPRDATRRPARYSHAVYDRRSESFIHADGGVRYYDSEQLGQRESKHVRQSGKCGTRVKFFTFTEPLPRDRWCDVMAALFVWNDDLTEYFSGGPVD